MYLFFLSLSLEWIYIILFVITVYKIVFVRTLNVMEADKV